MISSKNNPKTQPDTKSRPIVTLKPRLNDPKLESQSASSLLKPISLRNNVSPPRLDSINNDYFNAKAPSITNIRNTQASTKRNALPDSLNLHIHHKSVIEDPSKQNLDISTTTRGLSKEREKNGKSTSRLKLSISKTRPRRLSPLKSPPKGSLMPGFLSDNAEEETTPEVKKSGLNLFKAVAKRYMASQRIIHAFESTLGGSLTHHKKTLEDENNSAYSGEDSVIIDSMQQNKEKLLQMISMIENCVSCRKNKPELERYMEKVVELAQKTRNFELQISALKTQAKVLFTYNDLYRAIGAFKAIKHLADFNKSFTAKLKAYKYLAFCFHKVQNYKMAIFYYIKMLQTAWLCNSKRYELLAYDKIGIAYYYLGSLEKANYYHEKMMAGVGEPMDSKLRELGISKLLQRLEGIAGGVRKNIKINKVEDELNGYNIPASEDEFELPSPRNTHISHSNNEFASGHEGGDSAGPGKKRRALHILNKMMNDQNGREKKSVRSRPTVNVEAREAHSLTLSRSKNEVVPGSVMQQVLISHLSPNRLLGNFHPKDAQYIANSYITRGNEGEESYAVLDAKSLEQIRRKLEKLKENTEIALRKLLELQPETSLRKGGNKAQLGEKNKKTFIFQA